jgi:hypothetical protein
LEPLQSVNLRAALFRCLGELKKNGDLGREIIIRKTMLDDCKGEKFEELLAGFSTTVLRKLVAMPADEMLWNPAMKLATATAMTPTDYQNLLPLILVHQASLATAGERHARVRVDYDRFSQLLDDKKVDLTERANKEPNEPGDLQGDPEYLVRELQTKWLGNEKWATALLEGGSESSTDAFLELPFSKALSRATDSADGNINNGLKQDLVLDLEARVLLQRTRLRKWHEYNKTLLGEKSVNVVTTSPKEAAMVFREHQTLTVASIAKTVRQPGDRGRVLKGADKFLLSSVNEALTRINGNSCRNPGRPTPAVKMDAQPQIGRLAEIGHSPPTVAEDDHYAPSPLPNLDLPESHLEPQAASESETGSETEPELEIVHPSPPIVRLSPDLSASEEEPTQEPIKRPHTLVERTRKSMSLLPPQHDEPSGQRRRPRPSFPVNQFVTPRKASGRSIDEISRASTPQDQLFEEDAEYASVFKSRPRVALSPISSPAVHVSPSYEDESFALDDHDESFDWGGVESPSAAPRFR